MRYIFTIAAVLTTATYGSADTYVSTLEEGSTQRTCILTSENQALLAKLTLPNCRLPFTQAVSEPIVILTEAEKSQLITLADNGCVDAQQYVWLAYTKGLYGFAKNAALAGELKARYKAASVERRMMKGLDAVTAAH